MQGGGIERARVQTTVSGTMHSPECLQHCARQPDRTRLPSALPSMRGERSGGRKRGGCPTSIDAPGERGLDPTSARPSKDLVRRARLPFPGCGAPVQGLCTNCREEAFSETQRLRFVVLVFANGSFGLLLLSGRVASRIFELFDRGGKFLF